MLKHRNNQPVCPCCLTPLTGVVLRPAREPEYAQRKVALGGEARMEQTHPLIALGECSIHGVIRTDFIPR